MTKISVMHITYDMRIGGTEMVIKNIIEGSDPEAFEMSIFCVEEPLGPWGVDLQNNGIQISSKARKPGFDTSLIFAIRQHIKLNKIDIIHCHQYTPWVYGVLAAFGTKTKVIFTEHGRFYPDSSSRKRKLINPLLSKITGKIVSISNSTRLALVKFEFIPQDRIKVIYNGITSPSVNYEYALKLKEKLGIEGDTIVLGTIARLDPIKNHEMMLRAFSTVLKKHPNTKLILVGDGEERKKIEDLAQELGVDDKLIMTGYDPHPQHYLLLMDIFLLPSLSEGTSMTLLEAMALGKPSVVTNAGGNPEIISHNINGLVTANGDADKFSAAIIQLIINPELRVDMGEKSTLRFTSMFTNNVMIEAYKKCYEALYGERSQ